MTKSKDETLIKEPKRFRFARRSENVYISTSIFLKNLKIKKTYRTWGTPKRNGKIDYERTGIILAHMYPKKPQILPQ